MACPFLVLVSKWRGCGQVGLENGKLVQRLQQPWKGKDGELLEVRVQCEWRDQSGDLYFLLGRRGSSRDVHCLHRFQDEWERNTHAGTAIDASATAPIHLEIDASNERLWM